MKTVPGSSFRLNDPMVFLCRLFSWLRQRPGYTFDRIQIIFTEWDYVILQVHIQSITYDFVVYLQLCQPDRPDP